MSERPYYSNQKENQAIPENKEKPIQNESILLEITLRCYVGCEDCYKHDSVSSKSPHVDVETISKRLEWIKNNTEAKTLYLLGGEPLLHPNFKEIVAKAQENGLEVHIITSGQVSKVEHEQQNYKFMLEQYEQGKMHIELSYQPGRNGKAFQRTYSDILEKAESKKDKLKSVARYMKSVDPEKFKVPIDRINRKLKDLALFSTVTIPSSYNGNKEKFQSIYNFLLETAGINPREATVGKKNTPLSDMVQNQFQDFGKHFLPSEESAGFVTTITYRESKHLSRKVRARLWGPVRFEKDDKGEVTGVLKSLGTENNDQTCPAMQASFDTEKQIISTGSMLIRTDGELTYSTPSCISAPVGYLNVDETEDKKEIYQRLRVGLEATIMSNTSSMRSKSGEDKLKYCKRDADYPTVEGFGKICPSCPFDLSCNGCFSMTKEKRDEYYNMIKEVMDSMY